MPIVHAVMSRAATFPPTDPVERERWLDGIVPLAEGALLRCCSVDTLIREHKRGRLRLFRRSQRLWGIRRRDALLFGE
jgi:hypothetical protein